MHAARRHVDDHPSPRRLTPEEDAVGSDDADDEIDDLLPADLWFRHRPIRSGGARRP